MASLWLSTPAAAWKVHGTAHLSSPVSVDQHHHHANDGSPIDDRQAPSDRDGPGHDHIVGGAASLNATVGEGHEVSPRAADALSAIGGLTPILHETSRPPPYEPPRAS